MIGFIRSIIGLVSLIIAFFSANIYYDNIAKLLTDQSNIAIGFNEFFSKNLFSRFSIPDFEGISLPSGFEGVGSYLDKLFSQSDFFGDSAALSTSAFLAQILINVISWLAVFLLVFLIIRILGVVMEELFKLPLLKAVNAFMGFCVGAVKGSLFVLLIVIILQFFGQISEGGYFKEVVESSYFAYYILKFGIFRWLII